MLTGNSYRLNWQLLLEAKIKNRQVDEDLSDGSSGETKESKTSQGGDATVKHPSKEQST